METEFSVEVASRRHLIFVDSICQTMADSAQARGTGITGRTPTYLSEKILSGKAIIATRSKREWVGFAYLDCWEGGRFVSQSGLIVNPDYRHLGVARAVKQALFNLSRQLFPEAKLFSITTSQAVMTLNSKLGFKPVAFSELPHEARFWNQCNACQNCDILARTGHKYCLCTGMLYEDSEQ